MRKLVVFALLLSGAAGAWVGAGRMSIHYVTDVDTHATFYRAHCDGIAHKYLGPNGHGRLSFDAYNHMLLELQACNNTAATPAP